MVADVRDGRIHCSRLDMSFIIVESLRGVPLEPGKMKASSNSVLLSFFKSCSRRECSMHRESRLGFVDVQPLDDHAYEQPDVARDENDALAVLILPGETSAGSWYPSYGSMLSSCPGF
jgi:hypothetical protein